jgi:hypothetical protein
MSTSYEFHPTLELLEDRSTPAALSGFESAATAAGSLVAAPVQAQAAPAVIVLQNGVAQAVGRDAIQAQVAGTFATSQAVFLPTSGLTASTALSANDQAVLGFQGRFVLPDTGVQQRVGLGDGPLTQPPGLFLVGGGNDQPSLLPVQQTRPVVLEVLNDAVVPDEGAIPGPAVLADGRP